jgi:hypothetical protein
MPVEFKLKPSSAALMAALSAIYPLTGQAAAGRIDFAVGDVKALAPDGRSRPLVKGAEVESGEMIDTGSGRAQVRFSDGAQVSLSPQTQFRIDDYKFSGKADGSEKGFFSLLRGAMRTITGVVGRSNRDNYKVNTVVATIGIRGTEYSVTYGNSISVTTGEGVIEVCNAAGCLIVNSGETAFVPDANTRPVMTDKKAEIPPPPAQTAQLPGFTSGNNTNSDGTPAYIPPSQPSPPATLPSGPGYSGFAVGVFNDGSSSYSDMGGFDGHTQETYATFSGGGLASFTAGYPYSAGITQGTPVGMQTDGIMGWGRWIDGTWYGLDDGSGSGTFQHVHYVGGMPTPLADMSALQLAHTTATYTLSGYTYPTAWNSNTNTFTFGTQPVSGSLTANFGSYTVSGNLTVPMGGNVYSSSWIGSPPYGGIYGASFWGYGSVTSSGSDCSGSSCYSLIDGFFAGANAARAGLVYEFYGFYPGDLVYGNIHGAAVFGMASSASPPPLSSGPGYSLVASGVLQGLSTTHVFYGPVGTNASFSGGELASFSDTSRTITKGVGVGMETDGIMGWGRWIYGTLDDDGTPYSMGLTHYVVGKPTPTADMTALAAANTTATYTLSGYTYPTSSYVYSSIQPISGSLTADFGTSSVSGNLTVPFLSNVYSSSWSGTLTVSNSHFNGSGAVTSTGNDCSSCNSYIKGFFAGANAARAGLVYEFSGTQYGVIHGAAVFKR